VKIKIPISEKHVDRILILLFSACILVNLGLNFSRGSIASTAYDVVFKGKQYPLVFPIDDLFSKFERGRLFLKFDGFDPEKETSKRIAQLVYLRGVFRYYPGQIQTGDTNLIIKEGNEFLKNKFIPDQKWLKTNKFDYLLTFRQNDKGEISYDLEEVE
jgi:hypothetical protein